MKAIFRIIGVIALTLLILSMLVFVPWEHDIEQGKTDTRLLSHTMFEDYSLAFLMIGFIMFSAMLGGIFLAKEELLDQKERERRDKE